MRVAVTWTLAATPQDEAELYTSVTPHSTFDRLRLCIFLCGWDVRTPLPAGGALRMFITVGLNLIAAQARENRNMFKKCPSVTKSHSDQGRSLERVRSDMPYRLPWAEVRRKGSRTMICAVHDVRARLCRHLVLGYEMESRC